MGKLNADEKAMKNKREAVVRDIKSIYDDLKTVLSNVSKVQRDARGTGLGFDPLDFRDKVEAALKELGAITAEAEWTAANAKPEEREVPGRARVSNCDCEDDDCEC